MAAAPTAGVAGLQLDNAAAVKQSVSEYYGETLQGTSDLKTSACCTAKAPPPEVLAVLQQLPQEITERYYGCGSPFPVGLQGSGLRVLDLGCGTGRDCYVCAALVGEAGSVTGIDMTEAQLQFARKHSDAWQAQLGYANSNMRFVHGAIEQLDAAGIQPGSIDVIISNCVINLSPDKPAVLRQAYAALAEGGEVYFSDVYCDRRLSPEVRAHPVLLGECLGGALHVNDFLRLCADVGFADPRVLEAAPIDVHDAELRALLGDAAFYSVTFRLFKLPPAGGDSQQALLEAWPAYEDYGQTATYKGSLPGAPEAYTLDAQHSFPAGVPVRVSGATAALCSGASWLARHFSVSERGTHQGQFSSAAVDARLIATLAGRSAPGSQPGGCCPPKQAAAASGGCCPPKPAAASGGGCCPPKQAASGGGGCCPPKQAVAAAPSGGCRPPKQVASAAAAPSGGCCPPKTTPTPGAAAPNAGCCAPKAAGGGAPAAGGGGGGCGSAPKSGCC